MFKNKFVSCPHGETFDDEGRATDVMTIEDLGGFSEVLEHPDIVVDDEGKEAAAVLCGADYLPEATERIKENIDSVSWMVLDVDNDDPKAGSIAGVPTEEHLKNALRGMQAVVYTSPGHTSTKPRWRVLLPLKTPLPPKKYRSLVETLSQNLVEGYSGCINAKQTGDPCRLGFVGVTKNPKDYRWWEQAGDPLDWTLIPLEDEGWHKVPMRGLERQPQWTNRTTALVDAKRTYASRGYEDKKMGKARRIILWDVAKELWWDFAAEDDDFVLEILRQVNEQFAEAKPESDVHQKMREAWERTVGPNRIAQTKGPYGSRREPGNAISWASIKHLAKRLRRSSRPHIARVGEEMYLVAKGEGTIAEDPHTWTSAIQRVALALAAEFVWDRPERIADFFKPCLSAMVDAKHGEVPSLEEITSWIRVRLEREKQNKIDRRAEDADGVKKNISAATGGKRESKYTAEEWDTFQAPNGCGLTAKTILLQHSSLTWTFLDGTYDGPFTDREFDAQGYANLEAASDFIRLKHITEKGTTFVKLSELLQKHGSKCTPQVEYMCESSYYRPEDRMLILRGPVKHQLEPKFHPEVDEWLRKMTGKYTPINEAVRQAEAGATSANDDYDTICNWLACVVQLDHICAALYLQGPKSVGKGLFATGVGHIWKTGAISAKAALDHFNSLLTESPFIHVNEGLPRGMSASVLLRRTLADTDHIVTMKGVDSSKLTGCVRMVFTANNLRILEDASKKEKLQGEDLSALNDRFIHIRVRPEAADYLRSLGPRHKDFYEKFMLAEHTLWMNEKRWDGVKKRGLRFLVEGRNSNVADSVATNTDVCSDVCSALTDGLVAGLDPKSSFQTSNDPWFLVQNGELWVNTPNLRRQVLMRNPAAKYTEQDIVHAVEGVCHRNAQVRLKSGKRMRMWSIRLEALQNWLEGTPQQSWEDVWAGLEKLNTTEQV